MASPVPKDRLTVEEFLNWDDGTDQRYELVDGRIVAMAPPLEAHGTIVANLIVEIRPKLKPPWRVVAEAGIRLPDRDDTCFQADLAVTCSEPDRDHRWQQDPRLIVEVLSPSTEGHDLGRKAYDYFGISSVQEVVLVWTDRRRVAHWRRDADDWRMRDLIGDSTAARNHRGTNPARGNLRGKRRLRASLRPAWWWP